MTMRDSIFSARVGDPRKDDAGLVTQEFCFVASDPTFAGHFPTRPILPGVFQIEMTRMVAEEIYRSKLDVNEVTKAKFLWPIVPGETVRVELKLLENESAIQARANFFVGGRSAGEAILQLARQA